MEDSKAIYQMWHNKQITPLANGDEPIQIKLDFQLQKQKYHNQFKPKSRFLSRVQESPNLSNVDYYSFNFYCTNYSDMSDNDGFP